MTRFSSGAIRSLALVILFGMAACGGEKAGEARKRTSDSSSIDTSKTSTGAFAAAKPITSPSANVSFALRPMVGDRFSYRLEQSSVTDIGGRKIDDRTLYSFTLKVTSVNDDGSLAAQIVYDSIRIRRDFAAGIVDTVPRTIAFDTRRKPKSPVPGTEQYTALIGRPMNLTLDKQGRVTDVSNVDPIISAMLGPNASKLQPKEREALRQLIKVQAVASVVQQLFLQTTPDSAIAAGRTWTRRDTAEQMGLPSRSLISYKLTDIRDVEGRPIGRVVVSLKTEFLKKSVDNELVSATINEVDASGDGEALMMLDNGFPSSKKTRISMKANMTGQVKVGAAKGKTESINQSVTTHTNVLLSGFTPGTGR